MKYYLICSEKEIPPIDSLPTDAKFVDLQRWSFLKDDPCGMTGVIHGCYEEVLNAREEPVDERKTKDEA